MNATVEMHTNEKNPWEGLAALVLAAGQSRRMGQPKMLLPWGETTVLGQVLRTLHAAGLRQVLVVSGAEREAVERLAEEAGAECRYNPDYAQGEMLSSLQRGLEALLTNPTLQATLICLGDQPQLEVAVVRQLGEAWVRTAAGIIVPSYQRRRGHPWVIARRFWPEVLALRSPQTARDFLQAHASEIYYVEVTTPSILQDLDTPQEYARFRPA